MTTETRFFTIIGGEIMKKTIFRVLILLGIVAIIGVGTFFILRACGFTTADDFQKLQASLGDSFAFWSIVVLLQIIQTIFIPLSNQLITGATAVLFKDQLWKVWVSAGIGISIGSIILYLIGRFGGEKLVGWLLGDKTKVEKCQRFMEKGKGFYFLGMHIGFIPDDVLSVLAGIGKYNFAFVCVVTIEARFFCTAVTTFGIGLLMTYWWSWIILGVGVAILGLISFILIKKGLVKDNKVI